MEVRIPAGSSPPLPSCAAAPPDNTTSAAATPSLSSSPLLPVYLHRVIAAALPNISAAELAAFTHTPREYLTVAQVQKWHDRRLQYAYLLLARERFVEALSRNRRGDGDGDDGQGEGESESESAGISPELVLERGRVYEALGYAELALADAYVAYTLFLVVAQGEAGTDLVPVGVDGERWLTDAGDDDNEYGDDEVGGDAAAELDEPKHHRAPDDKTVKSLTCQALILLCRSALLLGCESQAKVWFEELLTASIELAYYRDEWASEFGEEAHQEPEMERIVQRRLVDGFWSVVDVDLEELRRRVERLDTGEEEQATSTTAATTSAPLFGWSQRLVYPWNDHEPDRMGEGALREINSHLALAAPALEARSSILPALVQERVVEGTTESEATNDKEWAQLGLYAKQDLAPGSTILEERTVLTAIRPHGEALCDACAADMESIPVEERWYCNGCNIPFCSKECHSAATTKYHAPNEQDEETEEGYPPAKTPFCPGTAGIDDLHVLGRAESSTTPEWDLYFLLLSRTLQMAETQNVHPLDLFEVKYLWGDFSPTPDASSSSSSSSVQSGPKTLPYSVRHHVELPLQWFEVLMHSRSQCRPYSASWLEKYDWWIVQTLFAKFRGVADAQQSTWTGKPEVAAVHPLWCLANHSCNPSVTWKPSGVRNLTVVKDRVWSAKRQDGEQVEEKWQGVKKGEEIWNHYTDIQEKDYRERRDRLQRVLGGGCRCERCIYQAKEQSLVNGHEDRA